MSTIVDVMSALFLLLSDNLTDVQVYWGPPPTTLGNRLVSIGDVDGETTETVFGNDHPQDELFEVSLTAWAAAANTVDQESQTRGALELYDDVKTLIDAHPNLDIGNSSIMYVRRAGRIHLTQTATAEQASKGRNASVEFTVQVMSVAG